MLLEGLTLEEALQILKDNKQNGMTKYFGIYTIENNPNGYTNEAGYNPTVLKPVSTHSYYSAPLAQFETEDEAINWIKQNGSFSSRYIILPLYEVTIDDINER
jgi:hypothetical protein